MSVPKALLLGAVLILLATWGGIAASCGPSGQEKTAPGLVTEVQARSLTQVETLTIQEQPTGRLLTFQAEENIGFTPSHLRQHMLQGAPVTVHYVERRGRLWATRVTD